MECMGVLWVRCCVDVTVGVRPRCPRGLTPQPGHGSPERPCDLVRSTLSVLPRPCGARPRAACASRLGSRFVGADGKLLFAAPNPVLGLRTTRSFMFDG